MILIIAYGNSLRRDDGAGFVLAEKIEALLLLAHAAVQRIDCHQLTPELALDISAEGISAVIFVDTRVLGPSDDLKLHIRELSVPQASGSVMGHHMDASILLAYSGLLSKKTPPPAWLITVPGIDFNHGEGLSATTRKVLDDSYAELDEMVRIVLDLCSRTIRAPDAGEPF